MNMNLADKVVVITGGSSGIGQATAICMAAEGARVVFTYNTGAAGARQTQDAIEQSGGTCIAIKADVTKRDDVDALFAQVKRDCGRVDVLVNNASKNFLGKDQDSLQIWHDAFEVNVFALARCTYAALALMPNGGKIINVSSVYAAERAGSVYVLPYSAAKAAVSNFTQTLAKQLAPKIAVNAVAPGYTNTPLWGNTSADEKKRLTKDQLIERFIEPQEIADAIVFVAKNDAVSGEVLVVDGGLSLRTL